MGLETATYIADLDSNNPDGADPRSQGDNHLRMLKVVLKNTFPGMTGRAFRVQTKSGNYSATLNDNASLLLFTGAAVLSLPLASSLGDGYLLMVYASAGEVQIVTTPPDGINGQGTFIVPYGQSAFIVGGASTFVGLLTQSFAPTWSTGDVKPTFKNVADVGWVMMNNGSIGPAASGATTRSHADCEKLFLLLWNNVTNAWAPVSGGRGASAILDWQAGKVITLPQALGRALAVAGTGSGLTARTLGETLGEESHILSQSETPLKSHSHGYSDPGHAHTVQRSNTGAGEGIQGTGASQSPHRDQAAQATESSPTNITISAASDASASGHQTMQPTTFLNVMIKL